MSIEPMRQSTSLYEKISEALEPIFLTQDQYDFLEMAINNWQDTELVEASIEYDVDTRELLEKLEHIVLTDQEES